MCRQVLYCLVTMITMSVTAPVLAQEATTPAGRGELLLTRNCARCHAVGRTGTSPHPEAPPFRTLSRKYKIEGLAEALAEGLSTGHPDMPEFVFAAEDVGAIIDYLQSISSSNGFLSDAASIDDPSGPPRPCAPCAGSRSHP